MLLTLPLLGAGATRLLVAEPLFQFTSEEVIGERIELLIPDLIGADANLRNFLYRGTDLAGRELLACGIKDKRAGYQPT